RCHEVGILYDGHLLASGKPETLIENLPFRVVEVKARPRKAIRQIVGSLTGVQAWRPVGDRLRLSVENTAQAVEHVIAELDAQLRGQALEVRLLREAKGTMEDVFVHMIEQRQAGV
ncbi:MAG: hypothetical protein AAGU05_05970, partial [Anaerolineaceae bacterium]